MDENELALSKDTGKASQAEPTARTEAERELGLRNRKEDSVTQPQQGGEWGKSPSSASCLTLPIQSLF